MSFRAFSTVLWYASALFIFGIAVEIILFRNGTPPIIGSLLTRPNFIDNLPPILILLLFIWVLFELGIKQRQIRREHLELARLQSILSQADTGLYTPKAFDLREPAPFAAPISSSNAVSAILQVCMMRYLPQRHLMLVSLPPAIHP